MLLLELSPSFPLFSFDPLALLERKHLLVFDPQLPTLELKVVEHLDDRGGLLGRREVCKGKTPEDAIVKVVVEGIRERQVHLGHELHQLLLLHRERDVLDHDRSRDQLVFRLLLLIVHILRPALLVVSLKWSRAKVGGEGGGAGNARLLVEPRLDLRQPRQLSFDNTQGAVCKHTVGSPVLPRVLVVFTLEAAEPSPPSV